VRLDVVDIKDGGRRRRARRLLGVVINVGGHIKISGWTGDWGSGHIGRSRRPNQCRTLGLDVINLSQATITTKGLILKMTISGGIHFKNKVREVHKHSMPVKANETTTTLSLMGPKTIERISEVGDMKAVPNQNLLTIQGDDSRSFPQHRSKGRVAHPNPEIMDLPVRDKGAAIGNHMICSTRVCNKERGLREIGLRSDRDGVRCWVGK
jgi:hypothetical protein